MALKDALIPSGGLTFYRKGPKGIEIYNRVLPIYTKDLISKL
jgi:hypothetical protein